MAVNDDAARKQKQRVGETSLGRSCINQRIESGPVGWNLGGEWELKCDVSAHGMESSVLFGIPGPISEMLTDCREGASDQDHQDSIRG